MGFYLKSWNGEPDTVDPRERFVGYIPGLTLDKLKVMSSENITIGSGSSRFLMREHIIRGMEEFVNTWVVYHAKLPDNETHEVSYRIKPSVIQKAGGTDEGFSEWAVRIPEAVLKDYRGKALDAFAKTAKKLKK